MQGDQELWLTPRNRKRDLHKVCGNSVEMMSRKN
jgi:hypothetical protein